MTVVDVLGIARLEIAIGIGIEIGFLPMALQAMHDFATISISMAISIPIAMSPGGRLSASADLQIHLQLRVRGVGQRGIVAFGKRFLQRSHILLLRCPVWTDANRAGAARQKCPVGFVIRRRSRIFKRPDLAAATLHFAHCMARSVAMH